jgi:hypothetical protein
VQHDGGARRCLVARRFAAKADALFRRLSPSIFSVSTERTGRAVGRPAWASFHPPMQGFHEPAAGTADIGELFLGRITSRKLVFSDDDFARQYFYVFIGKQIIKINYYGTFMD